MVDFESVQFIKAGVATLDSRDIHNVIADDHVYFLRPFHCIVDAFNDILGRDWKARTDTLRHLDAFDKNFAKDRKIPFLGV